MHETTPLLSVAFDEYNTALIMAPSSDPRASKTGHPERKSALKGRLKEIVLLELREDG